MQTHRISTRDIEESLSIQARRSEKEQNVKAKKNARD